MAAFVWHATKVLDVQAVVRHTSAPVTDADGVMATMPKPSPKIVTDEPPDEAAFDPTWKLTAGAATTSTPSVSLAGGLYGQCTASATACASEV